MNALDVSHCILLHLSEISQFDKTIKFLSFSFRQIFLYITLVEHKMGLALK